MVPGTLALSTWLLALLAAPQPCTGCVGLKLNEKYSTGGVSALCCAHLKCDNGYCRAKETTDNHGDDRHDRHHCDNNHGDDHHNDTHGHGHGHDPDHGHGKTHQDTTSNGYRH